MKMVIEKRILMEGLNCVSKALSTRNIIPVLNGIKFDLTKKGLYLTATDNDITIQKFIDKKNIISIDEIGCTVIYGKTLLTTISKLQNSNIMVENFENNVSLIDINHFESERYFGVSLAEILQKNQIEVIITNSINPFKYY